jgi:MFS family permease
VTRADEPGRRPEDPGLGRLLRWYPRAWRERYGEEFLAMVEDGLDGERPTWRLTASVARAGLRERGRALVFGQTRARRLRRIGSVLGPWWPGFLAGSVLALFPVELRASPHPGRAWQAIAALDALIAIMALAGLVVLAGGLVAFPAFRRFLRAGGWAAIRRRVAWAAGATAVAGGALAGLGLWARSRTYAQLNASWTYLLWVTATILALMVALRLWRSAATATARQLNLSPRGRTAEARLGALTSTAASVMLFANAIVLAAIQSSLLMLLLGVTGLAAAAVRGRMALRRAVARGR